MINKSDCTVMVIAYEKLLAHLKERLVTELGTAIESIVLYGSVARNEAHRDSDIDILMISRVTMTENFRTESPKSEHK